MVNGIKANDVDPSDYYNYTFLHAARKCTISFAHREHIGWYMQIREKNFVTASRDDLDQPRHQLCLIRIFVVRTKKARVLSYLPSA